MSDNSISAEFTQRARTGFLWTLGTNGIWQVISWGLTLVTARLLTPIDYGIVSLGEAIITYLMVVATFRLETWMVQRTTLSQEDERAGLGLLIALGTLCSLIGLIIAPAIGDYYGEPRVVAPFQVLSSLFILRALAVIPETRLKRDLSFKTLAFVNLWLNLLSGVAKLLLAYWGYGYWSLVWGNLIRELMALLVLFVIAGSPLRPALNLHISRNALNYGLSATLSSILWLVFTTTDTLIVGKLFGMELLGLYAMAFFLADLPLSKLSQVINPILVPLFSKLREQPEQLKSLFQNVIRWIVSLLTPVFMGLFVIREEVVALILGSRWSGLETPLGVMCFICLLRSLTGNASQLFFALGKPQYVLRWTFQIVIFLVPSFYLLGKLFNLTGIYVAWLLVYPIVGVIPILKRVAMELDITLRDLLRPLISTFSCSAIMVIGLELFWPSITLRLSLFTLILKVSAGMIIYVTAFRFLFREEFQRALTDVNIMFARTR